MKDYSHIIFDIDNTLLDFDKTEEAALNLTMKMYFAPELHKLALEQYHKINKALWRELEKGKISNPADINSLRFQGLCQEVPALTGWQEPAEYYLNQLGSQVFYIDGAETLMAQLKDQPYQLSLLTNGIYHVQKMKWENTLLRQYFTLMLTSEKAGVSKPDKDIFQQHLDQLGNPAREKVLMVGDSLPSDITGAKNAGIDSCWFNPSGIELSGDIIPTYEIKKLEEFLPLLQEN